MTPRTRWTLAIAAAALCYCVLSFYRATGAAPPADRQPFANAVQQRMEMVNELKEIRALLKEQNAVLKEQTKLLRSGELQVVVSLPEKKG